MFYERDNGKALTLSNYLELYPHPSRKKEQLANVEDKGKDGVATSLSPEQVTSLVQAARSCNLIYPKTTCKIGYCISGCTFKHALVVQKVNLSHFGLD